MDNQTISIALFPELDEPATTGERQEIILRGVEEHYAFKGVRATQMFTVRLPLHVYQEFKRQSRRWQKKVLAQNPELKELFTMTALVSAAVQEVILPMLKSRDPIIPPRATSDL